jgi:hypothetical protein
MVVSVNSLHGKVLEEASRCKYGGESSEELNSYLFNAGLKFRFELFSFVKKIVEGVWEVSGGRRGRNYSLMVYSVIGLEA